MGGVRLGKLLKNSLNQQQLMKNILPTLLVIPAIFGLSFSGCSVDPQASDDNATKTVNSSTSFAYVTNGVDPFWDLCAAGVRIAEKEFGITCEILMPPKGVVDQKRMMETLLANGVDGVAVSPIDAENQTPFLNEVAANTILITQDADAPMSDRLVYIGANNYKAGRALGKLVKEAIPEGGEVMLFVGRLEQLNARQRRQGVIDELLARPMQELAKAKFDPVDSTNLGGKDSKYVIVDTRTDNFDKAKAKSNAEDAITKYKDLKCMVGLFAYNSPACIDAIKEADKSGKIKICGFDEQDSLLQAITDGFAYGTISQLPWEYGYESIKMLKDIYEGRMPETSYVEKSFASVTQENIAEFWAKKKEMAALGKSK
jgi:ribose transport system substrate-binding protein